MKLFLNHSREKSVLILCLLFSVIYFPLASPQALAQSRKTSFSQLLASRANRGQTSFSYSPAYPKVGQEIQFTDTSTINPTSWRWDFGDGTTSTAQNPSHAFVAPGFRKVSLTASNGSSSKVRSRTITITSTVSSTSTTTSAASFTYTPSSPMTGQAVQFTDMSTNSPTSWQWHFGDGMTSTSENPTHPYGVAGTYTVTLDASNGSGTKTASQTLTVSSASTLVASFAFTPASPAAGGAVQFTDTSTGSPTSWLWTFGDGATSTSQNPSHTYNAAGSYSATLTATNSSSSQSASKTVTVVVALAASFTFSPASPTVGAAVKFTDTSTGSPTSWLWSFGDGSTSTAQNPSYTFSTAASYTVTLKVTNSSGSKSISQTVTVVAALTAAFTYRPTSPAAGQTVQFTDASTGSPTSWQWDFGDGTSSTSQNPSHIYSATGSYSVTLTIRSGSNLNNTSKTITISKSLAASFAYSPASPAANQIVQFTDTSTGSPTSWLWNFNDGATSTAQNPSHTFSATGSYSVTLTVTNSSGSSNASQTISVLPASSLSASFSYSPSSPTSGQTVQFTDTSTGTPTSWQWDFGDGGSSTLQNPGHVYITAGTCTVTLYVGNGSGTSNATRTIIVSSAGSTYELPAERMIDWTAAGVPGGIKTRTTTHAVTGVYGDDSHDDRATIQAVINACPSGEVVLLPAGTFKLSSALVITTPITLRGQGPTTILKGYSTSTPCVLQLGADSSYSFSAQGAAITGGYTKGSTSIVVSSASGFTVGHLMLIDQLNDGTFVTNVGSSGTATWAGRANGTRAMRQLVKITGISGTTISFSPALFYTYTASLNPQASVISTAVPALAADGGSIGVESLTILDGAGNSGNVRGNITWKVCTNSWLYKVSSLNCYSYHLLGMHILQNTIKMCYLNGAYEIAPSRAYGFEISDGSCSNLIEDSIVIDTSAELICEAGASGNIIAYCYAEPANLISSPNATLPCLQPSHCAHPMFNLYEGCDAGNWTQDNSWGTSSHNVSFRNHLTGSFGTYTEMITALDIWKGQTYTSVIGSVLGAAGKGFIYEEAYPKSYSYSDFLIYRLGYNTSGSSTTGGSTDAATTILRHANYDVANDAVIYNGSDNHTLPNSFYLASKPSWFGSLAWPAIGPDVSGHVSDIPAKWRWDQFKTSGLMSDLFKDH